MRRVIGVAIAAILLASAFAADAGARGGGVQLSKIVFDPPGSDTGSQTSLRKESS